MIFLLATLLACSPECPIDVTVEEAIINVEQPSTETDTDEREVSDEAETITDTEEPLVVDTNSGDTADETTDWTEYIAAKSVKDCNNWLKNMEKPKDPNFSCNMWGMNQAGEYIELYDLKGQVVLLEFSTVWCSVCNYIAPGTQEVHDSFQDFVYLTVLVQDESRNHIEPSDGIAWAKYYNITTAPVLVTPYDSVITETHDGSEPTLWDVSAWPSFYLLNRDGQIVWRSDGYNEERILTYIENEINETD